MDQHLSALPLAARRAALVLSALLAGLASARAQTVVQQPEFSSFTIGTTVLVPDGGWAYLGGVDRSSSASTRRGVPLLGHVPGLGRGFQNGAIGHEASASGVSVSATIIDLAELDAAVLAAAAGSRLAEGEAAAANRQAARLSQHVGRRPDAEAGGEPLLSVAEIRRRNQAAAQQRQAEAYRYLADAEAAQAEGEYGQARIYYRMALRRATGELADQISTRLAALPGTSGSGPAAGP